MTLPESTQQKPVYSKPKQAVSKPASKPAGKGKGNVSKASIKAIAAKKQAVQAEQQADSKLQAELNEKELLKAWKPAYKFLYQWAKASFRAEKEKAESLAHDEKITEAYRQAYVIQSLPKGLTSPPDSANGLIPFDESSIPEAWKTDSANYTQYAWLVNLFGDALDYASKHDDSGNELITSHDVTAEQAAILNRIADNLDMTKTAKGYQLTPVHIKRLGSKQAETMTGLIASGYVIQPVQNHYILTGKGLSLFGVTMNDLIANYETVLTEFQGKPASKPEQPASKGKPASKPASKPKTARKGKPAQPASKPASKPKTARKGKPE